MAAPKGFKPPNAGIGRAKGVPNKATSNARQAIAAFVDANTPLLQELLEGIRREEGDLAAFNCIRDLIEYHVPKLARVENTGEGNRTVIVVADQFDAEVRAIESKPS